MILIIHIISGAGCLVVGFFAMRARKRRGWHTRLGEAYHAIFVVLADSAITMAIINWNSSAYLFYIAVFSYGLALLGYLARKVRWRNWLGWHIGSMLGSYIAIITATVVVNIAHLPFLREIPVLVFWFLPTIVGTPLIFAVGKKYQTKKVA